MSSSGFRRPAKIEDMCINRLSQGLKIWQAALAVSGRSSCRVPRYNRRIFTLVKADHKVHIKRRDCLLCRGHDRQWRQREKKERPGSFFFFFFKFSSCDPFARLRVTLNCCDPFARLRVILRAVSSAIWYFVIYS